MILLLPASVTHTCPVGSIAIPAAIPKVEVSISVVAPGLHQRAIRCVFDHTVALGICHEDVPALSTAMNGLLSSNSPVHPTTSHCLAE